VIVIKKQIVNIKVLHSATAEAHWPEEIFKNDGGTG
jgi:hypothetical protein